jgi:toluene monooxygenase system protein A
MLSSIQTDEARHAQIGPAVVKVIARHDPEYVQHLVDKWFWRSWLFFAVVTGISMDYLTPREARVQSFKEFMQEWVLEQFEQKLAELGLKKPWYWSQFVAALDYYHHMVYASAYTYRATLWFDLVLPSPEDRGWLREKYPQSWPLFEPIWEQVTQRWKTSGPGVEWYSHGATPVTFCNLCQLVLCGGTPLWNTAQTLVHEGEKYIFCSEPCRWIFQQEPERYASHRDVVKRILAGEAPANLLELLRSYFGLSQDVWGRDVARGGYGWLTKPTHDDGAASAGDTEV